MEVGEDILPQCGAKEAGQYGSKNFWLAGIQTVTTTSLLEARSSLVIVTVHVQMIKLRV